MSANSGTPARMPLPVKPPQPRLFERPRTQLGWWAVGLMAAFTVMFLINSTVFMPAFQFAAGSGWRQVLLPFYSIIMLLCGLGAGIVGLVAVVARRERSWLVWLSLLPGLFVLFLLLGEFLFPH